MLSILLGLHARQRLQELMISMSDDISVCELVWWSDAPGSPSQDQIHPGRHACCQISWQGFAGRHIRHHITASASDSVPTTVLSCMADLHQHPSALVHVCGLG